MLPCIAILFKPSHVLEISEFPLLLKFLISLDLIADLELGPSIKGQTALRPLSHFGRVFLLVFERA